MTSKATVRNNFKWALIICACVAVLVWWLNSTRESTDALLGGGVVVAGRVQSFSRGTSNSVASVTFLYIYEGNLYENRGVPQLNYERGDYVYVMLLPEEPDQGHIIFHRKVAEADTAVNVVHEHIQLSEKEIRDMLMGKSRNYDNVKH